MIGRALAFSIVLLAVAACARPRLPDVAPPPAPFERYPYVQAVTDSSAVVVWMTTEPSRGVLAYWSVDGGDTAVVAEEAPAWLHRTALAPLPADTRIGYQVRFFDGSASAPHVLRTAPRPGTRSTFTVLVWGDSGWGSVAQVELAQQMQRYDAALALHTGDIAYDNGSAYDFTHRHFRVYRDLLAHTPLYPSVGNHDVRADAGRSVDEAFVLPVDPADGARRYYSFDWGRAHFIALDSNERGATPSDLRDAGVQYRWLRCDLAAAAADSGTDWIIVYFHHPLYSAVTGLSAHHADAALRRQLAPLFDRYRVDLVFAGHEHVYERSWPIRDGKIDRETPGTVYVITGGGGASLANRYAGRAWYTAKSARAHHFVALQVEPLELSGEVIDTKGRVIDRFELRNRAETRRGSRGVLHRDETMASDCPRQ